jgi:hypothetical protein
LDGFQLGFDRERERVREIVRGRRGTWSRGRLDSLQLVFDAEERVRELERERERVRGRGEYLE